MFPEPLLARVINNIDIANIGLRVRWQSPAMHATADRDHGSSNLSLTTTMLYIISGALTPSISKLVFNILFEDDTKLILNCSLLFPITGQSR